eukprot:scaffold196_cov371-Prasinococcus_capsulatus_cf.AAC.22
MLRDVTYDAIGTASSHTVCQMPVDGEYVSPDGSEIALIRCFPLGWSPKSPGSCTFTKICWPTSSPASNVSPSCGSKPQASARRAWVWIHTVEPEPGLPVDGAKVQHEAGAAIAVHIGGQIEQRAVPAPSNVIGGAGHVLPGQTRLEGEGHQHAGLQRPAERRALCAAAGATAGLELPETVEVEPRTRPHQLRSWILWQHWLRGVHLQQPTASRAKGRGGLQSTVILSHKRPLLNIRWTGRALAARAAAHEECSTASSLGGRRTVAPQRVIWSAGPQGTPVHARASGPAFCREASRSVVAASSRRNSKLP